MQCANRILCATYCITLPSVCGAGEWVNNYTGQGSLLLWFIARWTIIQDWAHARPARMGTIIRSEYRRRWRGERLYRDVDNYTIIQGRCCCGQTTRVESCVKMVLSACCASCAAGVLVDIPRWWLLIVTECFWLWATQLGNFVQTRCAEVTPPVLECPWNIIVAFKVNFIVKLELSGKKECKWADRALQWNFHRLRRGKWGERSSCEPMHALLLCHFTPLLLQGGEHFCLLCPTPAPPYVVCQLI